MPAEKSKSKTRFGALILAAGLSSRMDGFKPLAEIGGKPLLQHALDLFRECGVEEIVTVAGYRAEILLPLLEAASCRYVVNEDYHDGMFSSIRKGVAELQSKCDAFFLLPVDIPCVCPATVRQLQKKYTADSSSLVYHPEFQSRRGHPPLIDAGLIDRIIAYTGKQGMRGFLRGYEDRAVTVPVDDPFIRLDVDTVEDLRHLEKEKSKYC